MSDDHPTGWLTPLRARGWAVLPAPRQVELDGGKVRPHRGWALSTRGVADDDPAVEAVRAALPADGPEDGVVRLEVRDGAVTAGANGDVEAQAYRITLCPGRADLLANAPAGLFYAARTLEQLLANGPRAGSVPTGTITDWPQVALRVVHWDTKHHQDRLETLRQFIDRAAAFKINGVVFELEDKFEYPSHPVIGAPGAFTTDQLAELTAYALARHVQLIPNVQAPAHMCYVLKHEEFAHLRCDGSNYQICMDDPEARRLIFDMYDDVCRATPGVEYLHVSTDEVYYAGICERYRKPYNPENRSLTLVDFVNAAHAFLAERGRRVIIWLEFPILPEHVELLAPDILDGIMGPNKDPAFVRAANARGIRQFAYCPIQGAELLFPDYFPSAGADGWTDPGRLARAVEATDPANTARGNPIGTFAAAWDDAGLHNETFWLGWAAMAQGGWTPGGAALEQTVADFMDLTYGREAHDMVEVYRDLQEQARFFQRAWDRRPSAVRPPAYGYSAAKRPVTRSDLTLLPPALPALPDLAVSPAFTRRYRGLLAEVPRRLAQSQRLLGRLHANLTRATRNRHNLEVLLSLAHFVRHFIDMLLAVAGAEERLVRAAGAEAAGRPARAVADMVEARQAVAAAVRDRRRTLDRLRAVWEKGRRPRNASVGGRDFVHVMDDVKDHFADRRADLSYHTAPEESIGLDGWCEALGEIIAAYADARGIAVRGPAEEPLDE